MYGKGDSQILLDGFFVKKGGYAKIPPDGVGEYPPIRPVSFLANKGILAENTILMHFWFIFRPFWSILNPISLIKSTIFSLLGGIFQGRKQQTFCYGGTFLFNFCQNFRSENIRQTVFQSFREVSTNTHYVALECN